MNVSKVDGTVLVGVRSKWIDRVAEVNRELLLILSLFIIAGLLNWLVASHGMILGFYTIPTLFSAYVYGRRHAVLTERKETHVRELRRTYFGVLTILQQFISNDKYTHNHSYRVAMYAAIIAHRMGFGEDHIDDVRAAALLHDIGKLDTSRDILYKAASLTPEEMTEMRRHVQKGVDMLEPVGGALRRVLPIILAHHDKYDGSGYRPTQGEEIPIEARVLAVADAYDTLTSDRPYRRAVTPFEAKEIIATGSGASFDPKVVEAFVQAFDAREMDLPESVLI